MKKVLVLTHEEDSHASSVMKYLEGVGVDYFLVVTERLLSDYKIGFRSDAFYTLEDKTSSILLDSSWNIWNRRLMLPDRGKGMPKDLGNLVIDECEKTWDGLLMAHQGKVVNRPQSHFYANNKLDQIRFALRHGVGIYTPDTIVTTNPDELREFYAKHKGRICFKLQKGAVIKTPQGNRVVYTNMVTEENMQNADSVSSCPSLFQEYIEKDFEIRIISTDNTSTGIAIHSQDSDLEGSRIDYRRYDFDKVKYEKVELPEEVQRFCASMLKHYGLNFGAYDFIYSKDKRYVFLELNPNGQWLWLEEQSGFNLTKQIVENLI